MSEQSNRNPKTTPRELTADELDQPSGGMMNRGLPRDGGGGGIGGGWVDPTSPTTVTFYP
jgi:hypothetical protein